MLEHLANTWILARVLLGAAAASIALVAAGASVRVLVGSRGNTHPDERTLALERLGELASTALGTALVLELFAAVLTVVASDRLAGSIRGAMCAYGVVESTPWGRTAVLASLVASGASAAWLATRRVDVRLREKTLVKTLCASALVVAGLVVADFYITSKYLFSLDLDVVASCCSVSVDTGAGGVLGTVAATARMRELWVALAAGLVAGAAFLALARGANVAGATAAGVAGIAAGWLGLRAATDVVAPFVYEVPQHRCAYCLLRSQSLPAGPVLMGGLMAAWLAGVSVLALAPLLAREGASDAARQVLRRLGGAGAAACFVVLVAGAWPVVAYRVHTGTLELFR